MQKAFGKLKDVVGLEVICNTEWDLLWVELESKFPDSATFAPNVAGVVVAWCYSLAARLEDEKFIAWTETVVDKLESAGSIKLKLQVIGSIIILLPQS